MIARDATRADIEHVVVNMRAADAREVFACRWSRDKQALIDDLDAGRPFCIGFLALCAGEFDPIALLGARLLYPGVASVAMIATERWREIAFAATRFAIKTAIPCYLGPNARRAQCEAWVENHVSCAWLEAIGFEAEGVLQRLGNSGEDFVQYAWLNPKPPQAGI
jgi:ribosomal protein S18 acetylase RimI-like enzyme